MARPHRDINDIKNDILQAINNNPNDELIKNNRSVIVSERSLKILLQSINLRLRSKVPVDEEWLTEIRDSLERIIREGKPVESD